MRILLAHNSLYYPAHGGGDKSNRLLMEALAARGHQVRVVARANDVSDFPLNGVEVFTVPLNANVRALLSTQIHEFDPDIIVTSTDDPAQLLFELAVSAPKARVVHLVRATIAVPFGPDSSSPSRAKTEILRRADAIVGVSEYVARYVNEWGGMRAVHVPISLMEPGDYPDLGSFDNPFVTMVNPCAVKGIDIFLALADRMPHVRFAAVPTWGTIAADRAALQQRPNVTVLDPVDDIDDLLRRTRVALVPSIWAEARSRFVVEAMLRGIPVIASDAGGIREAKLGVPYLIPVNVISRYKAALDENMVPLAEAPAQNIDPWQEALARLTSDRAHWREIAAQSREAALCYAANLSVEPFERLLSDVIELPKATAPSAQPDARRKLATLLLKKRSAVRHTWFPTLDTTHKDGLRLFCFPHAGGGTFLYRGWSITGVEVCPVLLPGRESRASEPTLESMPDLVKSLAGAIAPFTKQPYALFGHSMGAGIAFELARVVEHPARLLIVSAARGPQYRANLQPRPDPSDEDLLAQLSALGESTEALKMALPLLRADTRLYRNYRFEPGPPLTIPIAAYRGADDYSLRREDLEQWGKLTIAGFHLREFPGGHFYVRAQSEAVLCAIQEDLAAYVRYTG